MSSITCGSCKNTHQSVAQVRDCYARQQGDLRNAVSPRGGFKKFDEPITDRQQQFLVNLIAERRLAPSERTLLEQVIGDGSLTKTQASTWIQDLLDRPKVAHPLGDRPQAAPEIKFDAPAGRYAVEYDLSTDQSGKAVVTKFYRIDRPTSGRWAGRTFVKVQAGDDIHPVRNPHEVARILERISRDPAAASRLYGQKIGSCGVCGRTLTDEQSRAAGIGPVCAAKMAW